MKKNLKDEALNVKQFLLNAGKAKDKIDLNSETFNISISEYGFYKSTGYNSRDGIIDACFKNTGKVNDK